MNVTGSILMMAGGLFLLVGTIRAGLCRSYLGRLHFLGVADTLGGILVLLGLMLHHPGQAALLLVAFGALLIWGPVLTYLMAEGGVSEERSRGGENV